MKQTIPTAIPTATGSDNPCLLSKVKPWIAIKAHNAPTKLATKVLVKPSTFAPEAK